MQQAELVSSTLPRSEELAKEGGRNGERPIEFLVCEWWFERRGKCNEQLDPPFFCCDEKISFIKLFIVSSQLRATNVSNVGRQKSQISLISNPPPHLITLKRQVGT